jgi:hypothetical protein
MLQESGGGETPEVSRPSVLPTVMNPTNQGNFGNPIADVPTIGGGCESNIGNEKIHVHNLGRAILEVLDAEGG